MRACVGLTTRTGRCAWFCSICPRELLFLFRNIYHAIPSPCEAIFKVMSGGRQTNQNRGLICKDMHSYLEVPPDQLKSTNQMKCWSNIKRLNYIKVTLKRICIISTTFSFYPMKLLILPHNLLKVTRIYPYSFIKGLISLHYRGFHTIIGVLSSDGPSLTEICFFERNRITILETEIIFLFHSI